MDFTDLFGITTRHRADDGTIYYVDLSIWRAIERYNDPDAVQKIRTGEYGQFELQPNMCLRSASLKERIKAVSSVRRDLQVKLNEAMQLEENIKTIDINFLFLPNVLNVVWLINFLIIPYYVIQTELIDMVFTIGESFLGFTYNKDPGGPEWVYNLLNPKGGD